MLNKQIIHVFNKTYYLLGKDIAGTKWYLQKSTWDCGWYWSFGYLESFTNNKNPEKSKDIRCHTHLNSLFQESSENAFNALKNFFSESVFEDDQLFEFVDYIETGYQLREAAKLFADGYSHYTERSKDPCIIKPELVKEINEIMIPSINARLDKMLLPEGDPTNER